MTDTQNKKRQNRQYVVELEEPANHRLAYTLGALGGMAIGAFLLRGLGAPAREAVSRVLSEMPSRVRGPGRTAEPERPGRLQRAPEVQDELLLLEDAVLDAFLDDDVLSARGIDVGAISEGIVELSGSVYTRAEATHAVAVAQGVQGVATVVNRMDIDDERARLHPRFDDTDEGREMSGEWTGHQSGMGSRRQGEDTDPARRDDSHHQREVAMEQADRAQFEDEGVHSQPRVGDPHDGDVPNPTNFREDELDNQSPYGKHAVPVPEQPQAMNSQARVGEGLKPGVELALEAADLPLKPHQDPSRDNERGV
ncbi:MAG TPA: BON domain-containing protein [Longimicrobium sp.]|nr:BON domain-containing protein [Longimicrobium sp.]